MNGKPMTRQQKRDLYRKTAKDTGKLVELIDRELNILHATMLAMQRAVEGLSVTPKLALIDGNRCPQLPYPARAIVKGDASEPAISAASILAKVTRDRMMADYAKQYPHYGFERHAGYGTALHQQALATHGICPIHRTSYAPIRAILEAKAAA